MPRPDVTKLLAESWHNLPHPDGRPRRLMHFSQFNQSKESQGRIRRLATDLAEATQHALERRGYTISHRDDPKAADAEGYKIAHIYCQHCRTRLFSLTVDHDMKAHLSRLAIRSITQITPECPHK
ncbi:hypothetical protein BMW24_003540 [Mycobacterium heckeshornense]|nr:hypothetical protein BMW24_003255 [Mycobacterium heckeshornense]PIJ36799.1 hypothetical protein BMW24_003540 [Mycobacterium heckeshornense]